MARRIAGLTASVPAPRQQGPRPTTASLAYGHGELASGAVSSGTIFEGFRSTPFSGSTVLAAGSTLASREPASPTRSNHGAGLDGVNTRRAIVGFGGHRPEARDATDRLIEHRVAAYSQSCQLRPRRQAGDHGQAWVGFELLADESIGSLVATGRLQSSVKAHNDFLVHSPNGPPSPPCSFVPSEFLPHVGGAKPGYTGHVPGKPQEFGSAAIGGTFVSQRRSYAQQGHEGGSKLGRAYRVPAPASLSERAASSAAGYGGHLPSQQHSMGISYWRGARGRPDQIESVADNWAYEA